MDYDPKEGWDSISQRLYYIKEENRLLREVSEHQNESIEKFERIIAKLREKYDLSMEDIDVEDTKE